jgi:hypothetical protein
MSEKNYTDGELKFRFQAIAFAEGIPLFDMIQSIEMPDGRTALQWIRERPVLNHWWEEESTKLLTLQHEKEKEQG